MPSPFDRCILLAVDFMAQFCYEGILFCFGVGEPLPVNEAHGEVYHAAMAPQFPGVEREPSGEQPHLGGHRVDAIPLHGAQDGQPELAPGRGVEGASVLMDELTRSAGTNVVCFHPQQTQGYVAQHRPKHGGGGLNVGPPPTVRLLVVSEVSNHGIPLVSSQRGARHVMADDQAGHQEHGTSIVTCPMAIFCLKHLVKFYPLPACFFSSFWIVLLRFLPFPVTNHLLPEYFVSSIWIFCCTKRAGIILSSDKIKKVLHRASLWFFFHVVFVVFMVPNLAASRFACKFWKERVLTLCEIMGTFGS
mmetsp:Transcript_16150/g.21371  ORF Transcript_16150/g.21371 Transcript_16150/m.21371 type:complete len:304 (-) Transcript_16150:230-1141(-)